MAVSSLVSATNATGTIASLAALTTSATVFTVPAGKTYKLNDVAITGTGTSPAPVVILNNVIQIASASATTINSLYLKAGDTLQIRNNSPTNGLTDIGFYFSFLVTEFTP